MMRDIYETMCMMRSAWVCSDDGEEKRRKKYSQNNVFYN